MKLCPCGSKKFYLACCGLFISGKKIPETPEQLMRSRYSAYTRANINYIMQTMKAPAANQFDPVHAKNWAHQSTWLGLKVIHTSVQENKGYVEFIARYSYQGKSESLHEVSEFCFEEGRWFYVGGKS